VRLVKLPSTVIPESRRLFLQTLKEKEKEKKKALPSPKNWV